MDSETATKAMLAKHLQASKSISEKAKRPKTQKPDTKTEVNPKTIIVRMVSGVEQAKSGIKLVSRPRSF
jgi:hypothetical protein